MSAAVATFSHIATKVSSAHTSLQNGPETPNHALQRTATAVTARAIFERSVGRFGAFFVRATVGHAPRQPPRSLSLRSLGHSERLSPKGH